MRSARGIRKCRYLRPGRLILRPTDGLKARSVRLLGRTGIKRHTTGAREELILVVQGLIEVGVEQDSAFARRLKVKAGESLFLPARTFHRVLNAHRGISQYVYVTGRATSGLDRAHKP
jgi:quercetin dioxygenase-like cupin family protein